VFKFVRRLCWKINVVCMSLSPFISLQITVCSLLTLSHTYVDLSLASPKSLSFYSLHDVSTLCRCTMSFCGTVVCEHFASYHVYPNYKWDIIW
jgi:hypothetical protein